MTTTLIRPGQEYVVGFILGEGFVPTICNNQFSPEHPCRVKVVSVGRKYAKVQMTGYTKPTAIPLGSLWNIQQAKASYRKWLEAREQLWAREGHKGLGQVRIDQLVEGV